MNIFRPKDRQELQNTLSSAPTTNAGTNESDSNQVSYGTPNPNAPNNTDAPNSPTGKRKKKITKNLTPYIVGIGLVVGLIIVFKVLKNKK